MSAPLPATMKAVEIADEGPNGRLVVAERAVPTPAAREVLIQIEAAGVNRPDLMQVAGMYPPPAGATDIPGLECAGKIAAVGADVDGLSVGDSVCALLTGGGYAEYAVTPAVQCLPIPDGLTAIEAASLPETFFTVWHNVVEKAGLSEGESFLVHGGTSGIGVTAIQIAKAVCGAGTVLATCGSAEKVSAVEALGADHGINYREEDFVERAKALVPGGINVILDMICGDYMDRNFRIAAPDGRINLIAFQKGPKTNVNFTPLLLKRLTLMGATLRAQKPENKGRMAAGLKEKVWPKLERGDIKPVIHATFPIDRAQDAHDTLSAGDHIGKVVLTL